jgi:predicted PurR-regulated permease PerM
VNPALTFPQLLRRVLTLTTVLVAVAVLSWAERILVPLALAILLAFVLTPVVVALERRGVPRLAAVVSVVLLVVLLFAGVGWVIVRQVDDLSRQLNDKEQNVIKKLSGLTGGDQGAIGQVVGMVHKIGARLREGPAAPPAPAAAPGGGPSFLSWVPKVAEPVIEGIADAVLVVVLTVFILSDREGLRDRLVRLGGKGRLTATTRALDETARRLSRYLGLLCLFNLLFGLAVALGLALLGVPYALLWGFLAAVLRFVPYVGPWLAALFPFALSVASAPGWVEPLSVLGLFAALEVLSYHFIEPVLYGQSVGVIPVGLLIAAAFWTWLWGPIGLVLSTPLTICLTVLGKYTQPLKFLDVLLGVEPPLDKTFRYYQRLLARDQDEAAELVEEYLQHQPLEALYDEVLLPALILAQRDRERGTLSADDLEFLIHATREIVEDQEPPAPPGGEPAGECGQAERLVLAWPARSEVDDLTLAMFRQLLEPIGCRFDVLSTQTLAAEVLSRTREACPFLVAIAAVPPGGLTQARYLCRRLRHHCPQTKVLVGRWGEEDRVEAVREDLRRAGADLVGTTLRESRDQVIALIQGGAPLPSPAPPASPQPAAAS